MSLLKLDAIDIRILATVQECGRVSKTALAEKVNLSATPCWIRLNRLEKAGIIRGYHAEIAFELIAKMTTV
ncbi:MAG: Lrp/AsnC family transcriptional regulator, partial [Gammaproteobacteria bacterium]